MPINKTGMIVFITIGILCFANMSVAGNRAVWIEGEVTRTVWTEKTQTKIEVDNIVYTILPDIRVTLRYLRNKGAYNERPSSVNLIHTGQKITMKVRKEKVIQIILF